MTDPWKRFKGVFQKTHNLDQMRHLEIEISGTQDEIVELSTALKKLDGLLKDPDSDRDLVEALIESVREDLQQAKSGLSKLTLDLKDKEVKEHIYEMEAKDAAELEGLMAPKTGPIAQMHEEISRLSISASVSKALVLTHEADLSDAELALRGQIAMHFPDLKRLLEAMLEAQEALEATDQDLKTAKPELVAHQDAFDLAREQMEKLSSDKDELPWADHIVDDFRLKTGLLASMQEALRVLYTRRATERAALEKTTTAFEQALTAAVKAPPSDPDARAQHKKLVELDLALQEAKEQLAQAVDAQTLHDAKVKAKALELTHLEDRAALLEKRSEVLHLGGEISALLNGAPALKGLAVWEERVDVLAEEMGDEAFRAFQEKGARFTSGLANLVGLGMSQEEVQEIYRELLWPERWHPPFTRAQEANWLKVTHNVDKVSIEQSKRSARIDTLGFPELARTEALKRFGTGLKKMGLIGDDEAAQVNGWLTLVTSIISLGQTGQKAIRASKGLRDDDAVDPVEHMMLVDDCLSAIGKTSAAVLGAAKDAVSLSTAEAIAVLVPGLGALSSFGNACAGAISATNYWMAAVADAEVHRQTQEKQHRLEASADHVQTQGKHVAARAASKTAIDLIAFCGHICTLSGVAAPVGAAVTHGTMALGKVKDVVTWAVDATRMERARKLLDKAKSGDAKARAEVFRHHGQYAAALIALLAQEGDPMALSIYRNHRITPEMVVRSSATVLQKYLLRELQEETLPTSWTEMAEWFRQLGERIADAFTSAGETLSALAKKVAVVLKRKPSLEDLAEADLAMRRQGLVSVTTLQTAVRRRSATCARPRGEDPNIRRPLSPIHPWFDPMQMR